MRLPKERITDEHSWLMRQVFSASRIIPPYVSFHVLGQVVRLYVPADTRPVAVQHGI